MSMTQKLFRLYQVDQQYRALKSRVDSASTYLKGQTRRLEELKRTRETLTDQMHHSMASSSNTENEARTIEERIARFREQMNQAQTNKQYKAFLLEINTLKVDKDALESKALEEMSKTDDLKEQLAQVEQQIAEREKVRIVAEKDVKGQESEIEERLGELKVKKEEAAKDIPAEVIADYKELSDWHDGEEMAVVLEEDAKRMEYSCGECNMQVPIERISALLSHGNVTRCPNCQRFLYIDTELQAVFDKKFAKNSS